MGFSGIRALIMVAVLVGLLMAVSRFDLPGWLVPVGLVLSGLILKNAEQRASG
jgi:hypothetical protein